MFTLKIMGLGDKLDSDLSKEYRLISDVREVRFKRSWSAEHDRTQLGLREPPRGKVQTVCVAVCESPSGAIATYLLTGLCYVLNDEGKTVDIYCPVISVVDEADAPNLVVVTKPVDSPKAA